MKEIGDISINPMWVDGFDTVLGGSDNLLSRVDAPDDFALQWCDRLGEAINLHYAALIDPNSPAVRAAARRIQPADLSTLVDRLTKALSSGQITDATPEGARALRLLAWGYGLCAGTFTDYLDPTSELSPAERAAGLAVVARLIVAGTTPAFGSVVRAKKSAAARVSGTDTATGPKKPSRPRGGGHRLAGLGRP